MTFVTGAPRSGVPITDKWIQPRLVFDQNYCTAEQNCAFGKSPASVVNYDLH